MKLAELMIYGEPHPPVANAEPPLGRSDVGETQHVTVPRARVTVERGNHPTLDLRIESIAIALRTPRPDNRQRQGIPQRRFTSA